MNRASASLGLAVALLFVLGSGGTAHAQLQGSSGLPCYGNGTCDPGLTCNASDVCQVAEQGSAGGACYGNGTCNAGQACSPDGVCVVAAAGSQGGACFGNGTCNAGLSCDIATNSCNAAPQNLQPQPQPQPATGLAPVAGAAPAAATPPEPPLAASGGRWGLSGGLAFPTGDFGEGDFIETSFFASMRAGKETITGNTGFTLGGRVMGVYWLTDSGDESVTLFLIHAAPEVRGAYHMGNKVLYVSGSLGLDASFNDQDGVDNGIGLGMNIDVGIDILTNPTSAFGAGLTLHPGFTKVVDVDGATGIPDVTFFGLFASYSTY